IHKVTPTSKSLFFFSSRRRHTRFSRDWSSDVCSSDLVAAGDKNITITSTHTTPYTSHNMRDCAASITWLVAASIPALPEASTNRISSLLCSRANASARDTTRCRVSRSEERRVGKEGRGRGLGEG